MWDGGGGGQARAHSLGESMRKVRATTTMGVHGQQSGVRVGVGVQERGRRRTGGEDREDRLQPRSHDALRKRPLCPLAPVLEPSEWKMPEKLLALMIKGAVWEGQLAEGPLYRSLPQYDVWEASL